MITGNSKRKSNSRGSSTSSATGRRQQQLATMAALLFKVAALAMKTAAKPLGDRFQHWVMQHPEYRQTVLQAAQVSWRSGTPASTINTQQTNKQAGKPASQQPGRQAGNQAGRLESNNPSLLALVNRT